MNDSSRHHYIPKFFIRNFTDDDGLLFVFNKEKGNVLRNKQSPKALFFEENRNTVDFSGQPLDNLESMYSDLDNLIAKDYFNVLKNEIVTPEELTSITLLANLLKWRVPKSDEKFNQIKNDLKQESLGIKIDIIDKSKEIKKEAVEHIENSNIFKESKRILLSILPFLNHDKLLEIHNNSFLQINPVYPSLIGDNPIIIEHETEIDQIGNFIFPLSSDITFIYKQNSNRSIANALFFFYRDLVILHHSTKYVGCKNKEHLEKIVEMYNQIKAENKIDQLEKFIFKNIL